MSPTARPAGTPIGRALDIPAGITYDDLREVIAAIDRVHGDGNLPPIPVRIVAGLAARGRFRFDEVVGPISIALRAHQVHVGLTLVHEIGHFLDLSALGGGSRFGSTYLRSLEHWRKTAAESRAYQPLAEMLQRGTAIVVETDGPGHLVELEEDELVALRRLLRAEELWACAYAQYVATRSGHVALMNGVEALRTRPVGRVYYPRQWDDDDFEPIASAIDSFMVSLGWRR